MSNSNMVRRHCLLLPWKRKMDKNYFNPLQLRPDISFLDRVQFLTVKQLWLENYHSTKSLPRSEELVGNDFLAVNKILFFGGSL